MIAVLDHNLLDYPEKTQVEFNALLDAIDKPKSTSEVYENLQDQKSALVHINQESILTAKTIVSPLHWFIISLLGAVLSFLLLTIRDEHIASSIISSILILGVFETLGLIHVIDSNLFLAQKLAFKYPQQIFQTIGLLNYYPETVIKKGWAKNLPAKYRVGIYKNYPASFEKQIKVVGK